MNGAILELANEGLRLRVAPERGGRVLSLLHVPTARELLWQQTPQADWPRYGVPEAEADVQGWDECCPAIGPGLFPPGPWGVVPNPAQGEVYALPWQCLRHTDRAITLRVHGVRFPYTLERTLELRDAATLVMHYTMRNHAALPFPYIWSLHPLLDARMGARITLPATVTAALIDSSEGGRLGAPYATVAWPLAIQADGVETDLARVVPGSGWADKLYMPRLDVGHCTVRRADGLSIALEWQTTDAPHLGIWIDTRPATGGLVALEPCRGYPDQISAAAVWGDHALLPPAGEQRWSVRMRVQA